MSIVDDILDNSERLVSLQQPNKFYLSNNVLAVEYYSINTQEGNVFLVQVKLNGEVAFKFTERNPETLMQLFQELKTVDRSFYTSILNPNVVMAMEGRNLVYAKRLAKEFESHYFAIATPVTAGYRCEI